MNIISIDTESCSGKNNDGSLCSFGYYLTDENFNKIQQKDIIINPIPEKFNYMLKVSKINFAYSESVFRKSPRFSEYYDVIKDLLTKNLVIGFSYNNDIAYINNACERFNLDIIEYEYVDVQLLYKLVHPTQTELGLKTIAKLYNIEFLEHRSDEDARVSLLILQNIIRETNKSLKELLEYYKIEKGKITKNGYYYTFSKVVLFEELNFKRPNKYNKLLFSKFITENKIDKNLFENSIFYKKTFDISNSLVNSNVVLARKIYKKLIDLKAIYLPHKKSVDFYITDNITSNDSNEEKENAKTNVLTINQISNLVDLSFDLPLNDNKYLTNYCKSYHK